MKNKLLLIGLLMAFSLSSTAQSGSLRGKVFDASTNKPLAYASVVVYQSSTGAITDGNGIFEFNTLYPGFVRIQVSLVGYKTALSAEIEITNAQTPFLEIKLDPGSTQLSEVSVLASPFRKTAESPLSLRTIGLSEIETNPGSNRDISRVIQSYPGVVSTPAYRNDMIIRGGGPSESRFFLDGIEVPTINHFSTQGASGGPIGIINADLIREVNFYSGAFPADRGNAMSGIFEFVQTDGNKENTRYKASLGASEVTATVNGPISKNTTYIISARRSYLQLLFKALQLPFLPTYNDTQFKIKSKLSPKDELILTGLGSFDDFKLNTGIKNPDDQQTYLLSVLPVYKQWTYTIGAVYRHYMENDNLQIIISRSHLNNRIYKYLNNDESSEANKILSYNSNEIENKFRIENRMYAGNYKFNIGGSLEWNNYTNRTNQSRYYEDTLLHINYQTDFYLLKYAFYSQVSRNFFNDRLSLSAGLRIDAANYNTSMRNALNQLSPRLSVSYELHSGWFLNAGSGIYYELPAYTSLGYQENGLFVNKTGGLKYIRSKQLEGGVEYRPQNNLQIGIESFGKWYDHYPFSVHDGISLANKGADYGVIGDERLTSAGVGRAYGAEIFSRINDQNGFNLNTSFTWFVSEFKDYRGIYIPSSWDSKYIFTLTTIRSLKRNWKAGAKFRFVGGLPYTPYDMTRSALIEAWNLQGGPYHDTYRLNSERLKPFTQLDVRIDKAYYLKNYTLKFYIDIQNLMNSKFTGQDYLLREQDIQGNYLTTTDGKEYILHSVRNTSGNILPSIGAIVEF